jgi:hypothetical protein
LKEENKNVRREKRVPVRARSSALSLYQEDEIESVSNSSINDFSLPTEKRY